MANLTRRLQRAHPQGLGLVILSCHVPFAVVRATKATKARGPSVLLSSESLLRVFAAQTCAFARVFGFQLALALVFACASARPRACACALVCVPRVSARFVFVGS